MNSEMSKYLNTCLQVLNSINDRSAKENEILFTEDLEEHLLLPNCF